MQSDRPKRLRQVLRLLVSALIVKVTVGVVLTFGSYLPPDFDSGFLIGRESYFRDGYHLAFYAHIISGPCSLLLGMVLLSEGFRRRFAGWHRKLGRVQVANVLLVVAPSGIWMSFYAETGALAGVGFGTLAVATGLCVLLGWRSAVNRRFAEHLVWMLRCYVLLSSAVVLRLTTGVSIVSGIEGEWTYQMAAWTSWLVPLAILELWRNKPTKK